MDTKNGYFLQSPPFPNQHFGNPFLPSLSTVNESLGPNTYIILLLMEEILRQLIGSVPQYLSNIYKALDIPGACLGFLPSTVCVNMLNHLFINPDMAGNWRGHRL